MQKLGVIANVYCEHCHIHLNLDCIFFVSTDIYQSNPKFSHYKKTFIDWHRLLNSVA